VTDTDYRERTPLPEVDTRRYQQERKVMNHEDQRDYEERQHRGTGTQNGSGQSHEHPLDQEAGV